MGNNYFSYCLLSVYLWHGVQTQTFSPLSPPGCQRSIGLSNGKAKVCSYSGWYYCSTCHVDDSFLIPARLVHNWDTSKYKVISLQVGLLTSKRDCSSDENTDIAAVEG